MLIPRLLAGATTGLFAVVAFAHPMTPALACRPALYSAAEYAARSDTIVVAFADDAGSYEVTEVLKGPPVQTISFSNPVQGACDTDPLSGPDPYLLFLTETDTTGSYRYVGPYLASFDNPYIGSMYKQIAHGPTYIEAPAPVFERPDTLPNGGGALAQAEAETKSEPWPLFLAGAFLVPLAVLAIGAYVQRRGGGH